MLNIFPIKISKKVKRIYLYNKNTDPKKFAKNMTRINNIFFVSSSDLIWGEFLDIKVNLKPYSINKYIKKEEILEGEGNLFVNILYRNVRKIFLDNGFFYKNRNKFISKDDKFIIETNREINCHITYEIKIYKIKEKYYLAINPGYTFLSKDFSTKSKAPSSYLYNMKSGKSFQFVGVEKNKLIIQLHKGKEIMVRYPENYYFNYSSSEAKEYNFSKEKKWIYQNKLKEEWGKFLKKLNFLKDVIDLENGYKLDNENQIKVNPIYNFENGNSNTVKDIFKYSFKDIKVEEIELVFFFYSMEQLNENYENVGKVFGTKKSPFFDHLQELGIKKVRFLKNPKYNKAFFKYDKETLEIDKDDKTFLENLENNKKYIGIIILDEFLGDIETMIKNFPKNIIMQPILKENINLKERFVLKSFAYKIAEFTHGAIPFEIEELNKFDSSVFIGIDLSHDYYQRKSHLVMSGMNYRGKIIYIKKDKDLELNEKVEINELEKHITKIINKYKKINGKNPKEVYLYRDGLYLEDIEIVINYLKTLEIKLSLIEVDKRSLINSKDNLKGKFLNLENSVYVYYINNYFNQKGVELNIKYNDTSHSDYEIIKQAFFMTKIHYGSPYTSIKLPYPIYVTNKVGRTDYEWRLTIPYLE